MESKSGRYDIVEIYGPRLKVLRRKAKLTQEHLAEAVALSRGYIGVMERESQISVSRAVAERLASALGTTVPDLVFSKEREGQDISSRSSRKQRRRGFRFGAAVPVVSESRKDMLQHVLRQLEELTETVRELLSKEE